MLEIVKSFAHVFAMMTPWLVFGFLMAGIIAVWIPRSWVNRVMGGSSGFRGIIRAVAIGVPLPICSCGVLPIAAGLRKHGAGKGPTAAAAYVAVIVVGAILCGIAVNLVPNALPASSAAAATGHALSAVHWAAALFLAAMMVYNLVHPVQMGHAHSCK